MPFRTFNCTTGIAAEWWIWQRVQVRRYAHDWNLGEPSLKWLSAKFRAVLAGLTAAPESRSVPALSSPNDGSHHWSQTPLSRRKVVLG